MSKNKKTTLKELAILVFEKNQATKQNKDRLFKLAKADEDIDIIEKLASNFKYQNAIECLKGDLYTLLDLYDKDQKSLQETLNKIQNIFLETYPSLTLKTLSKNEEYNKTINEFKNVYSKDLQYAIKNKLESEFEIALEYMTEDNNLHYIKYLIENGFDITRKVNDRTLLSYIIDSYKNISEPVETVEYLILKGADITIQIKDYNEQGNIIRHTSLLESAILNKNINIAKLLIQNKVHLLLKDSSLSYAVSGSHYEIVELLLKDIDLEKIHNKGFSQLIIAIEHDDIKMVEILLNYNINTNMRYAKHGFTALMIAVANNKNILIEKINNDDNLKLATKEASIKNLKEQKFDNHNDIAKLLIENGANIDVKDNYGSTAFDIAREMKNYEIMKLLLNKSKNSNFNTKIDTKIHLQYSYYSLSDGKRYYQQRYFDDFIATEDSKNFEELKQCIKEGGDAKRINLIEKVKNNFDSDYIKFAIDNGVKINISDNNQMSALHHAVKLNKMSIVKIFLEKGIDILYKNKYGETALDIATSKDIILLLSDYEEKLQKYTPKRLIQLLTNFRQDTPIKYTTHLWDMNFKDEYKDFDGYMRRVKEQWNQIEDELKTLSPRLHKIIYNFLLNDDEENATWYNYNNEKLSIGWSSLKGLREWCNDGNDPFKFQLEKEYRVNNQTLKTFGEVITLFKQEIQVRRENNVLENIFIDIEERLDEEFEGVFEFELVKLKGKTFYTDVMVFKDVLHKIFEMIKLQPKHNKIKIMIEEDSNDSYYELKIIQEDSLSGKSAKDMLNIVNGGDFSSIKESLTNLCDFSIESSYENENYRINYLSSMNENDIEILEDKPQGFTYMLRFYR